MSTEPLAPRYQKCADAAARKAAILAEEIEWQLKSGQGWWTAMKAVGYTNPESLSRRLYRSGRHDLAAVFKIDEEEAA